MNMNMRSDSQLDLYKYLNVGWGGRDLDPKVHSFLGENQRIATYMIYSHELKISYFE